MTKSECSFVKQEDYQQARGLEHMTHVAGTIRRLSTDAWGRLYLPAVASEYPPLFISLCCLCLLGVPHGIACGTPCVYKESTNETLRAPFPFLSSSVMSGGRSSPESPHVYRGGFKLPKHLKSPLHLPTEGEDGSSAFGIGHASPLLHKCPSMTGLDSLNDGASACVWVDPYLLSAWVTGVTSCFL